jgi:subtilisin family serine protease
MWHVLFACFVLSISATAALAEERVLLYPQELKGSPAASPAPSARSGAVSDSLQALRQKAAEKGRVKVIAGTRVAFGAEELLDAAQSRDQRAEIAAAASGIRQRFAGAIRRAPASFRSYDSIPFVALEVTAAELDRLAADPDVISLTEDKAAEPFLPESIPLVQANQAHAAGFAGAGQTVAILDTGVDRNHAFLGGRVIEEACFSTGGWCPGGARTSTAPGSGMPCPIAGCEHGTHVAGIAAGGSSSTSGVASAANIFAIQIASNVSGQPRFWTSDYLAALEHVFAQRDRLSIAAVNMSLGGGRFTSNCDSDYPPVTAAIRNLRSAGIATVVASGNDGYTNSLSYPACISDAVSVGAVSDVGWGTCTDGQPSARDKVACYSNSAAFLSLLAPGSRILSAGPGNTYFQAHGTSMAAPHVAGAWAVLKQKSPSASVNEVLSALQNSGTQVSDYRNGITKGRIDVMAALNQLSSDMPVLAFTRDGTGRGSVTFSPAGSQASCSANCANAYESDAVVTLTAAPVQGSVFSGWAGDCSGTAACTLTMSQARQVTASFTLAPADTRTLSYTKRGLGQGTVTFSPAGSQASCAESCASAFALNTQVTLQVTAQEGSFFKGWSGSCSGTRVCRVRMSASRSVTAIFERVPVRTLSYRAEGSGRGTVTITHGNAQESCTGNCTRSFADRSQVTLTAQASAGSRFRGWGGACRGTRTCTLNLRASATVTARFEAVPVQALTYTLEGKTMTRHGR